MTVDLVDDAVDDGEDGELLGRLGRRPVIMCGGESDNEEQEERLHLGKWDWEERMNLCLARRLLSPPDALLLGQGSASIGCLSWADTGFGDGGGPIFNQGHVKRSYFLPCFVT